MVAYAMRERVALFGGPLDGESMDWQGGDLYVFPAGPARLDFSAETVEPFTRRRHIYRRSLNTENVFVYQP